MAFTAREIKRQQQQARREREAELRKRDREKLRRLRAHLKHARTLRKARVSEIVKLCRKARIANRERVKAIRAAHRKQAAEDVLRLRDEARGACESAKETARQKVKGSVARAAAALQAEQQHQRTMRLWADPDPLKRKGDGRGAAARRRAEARSESDSEVAGNIPVELLPAWEAVKHKIKESPHRTRTEAFLEWAHDHPADVRMVIDREIERDVARLVAAEAELRERNGSHWRQMNDEDLADEFDNYDMPAEAVPF